ncbi:MAG: tetratricopeptide repeat protein, partial [Nevskia sp.]|nr:tetratricopeptide repeat protein [Nevskia sp.]
MAASLLWLGLAAAGSAVADSGQADFQAGISAYHAGDLDGALAAFQRARGKGLPGANLDFNLGLTYYKLGRYADARSAFERLRPNADYAALAEYHLGLVAARQGDDDQAATHLQSAARLTRSEALRTLAQSALQRIGSAPVPSRPTSYLSAGIGYDSNPGLLPGVAPPQASQPASGYGEVLASLDYPLPQPSLAAFSLHGSLYAREYFSAADFDQQVGDLSLRYQFGERWRTTLAGDGEVSLLDGHNLQDAGGIDLQTERALAHSTLSLRYRGERVSGGGGFTYLDGWRQRAGLGYAQTLGGTALRGDYEFETNDRRDLSSGPEFFSESPQRQGLGLRLDRALNEHLSLECRAGYRYSRYRDDNRMLVNGQLQQQRLAENLEQLELGARLRLAASWNL